MARGKEGTVEKERRRSPKSKLGEKSRDQGRRGSSSTNTTSGSESSPKIEQSGSSKETMENACGMSRRPSLTSVPPLSAVSRPRRPRTGEEPRRRPGSAALEKSGEESFSETRAQRVPARGSNYHSVHLEIFVASLALQSEKDFMYVLCWCWCSHIKSWLQCSPWSQDRLH